MIRFFIFCLFLSPFWAIGQTMSVDEKTENIALLNIVKVYKDPTNKLQIQQILSFESTKFKATSHLNFGITYTNHWLTFCLKNTSQNKLKLFLALESITGDSIFLYKTVQQKLLKTDLLGEYLPFSTAKIKHRTPVFEISLKPHEQADFYLTTKGNGQPINLTASLFNASGFHQWDVKKLFFLGLIYGIMLLILILNVSFFLLPKRKSTLYFLSKLSSQPFQFYILMVLCINSFFRIVAFGATK